MDALEIALIGPEAAAYQRRFGNQQMMEGTSGAPVQHWTQALNRVAQGAVGALREDGVRENEQRAAEMRKQALMNALNGGDMQGSAIEMLGNPATEDMGMQLAQNVFSQRQAAEAAQARAQEQELAHQRQKDLIDYRASVASQGGGGAADYGKAGQIVQGGDGRYYTVQFASDGTRKILPLTFEQAQVQSMLEGGQPMEPQEPVPLQPARGVTEVDTGTEVELRDRMTGEIVQRVPKQLAEAELQKAQGKSRAEALSDLPRVRDNAYLMMKTIDQAMAHPGKQYGLGIGGLAPAIPNTDQAGFVQLVNQMTGKTFLEAFNSLRGGGHITEAEGRKATDALARLSRLQRVEDFDIAMADLREVVQLGLARAERSAGVEQPESAPQQTQAPALPPGFSIRRLD